MSSKPVRIFEGWHEPTHAYDEAYNLGRRPIQTPPPPSPPSPPAPTIIHPHTGVMLQPRMKPNDVRPLLLSLWNHYGYLTDWLARDLGMDEARLDRWRFHPEEIDAEGEAKIRQLYAKTFPFRPKEKASSPSHRSGHLRRQKPTQPARTGGSKAKPAKPVNEKPKAAQKPLPEPDQKQPKAPDVKPRALRLRLVESRPVLVPPPALPPEPKPSFLEQGAALDSLRKLWAHHLMDPTPILKLLNVELEVVHRWMRDPGRMDNGAILAIQDAVNATLEAQTSTTPCD